MVNQLNTTELDFDQIKLNLKNYLKRQSTFSDYDFEGSGLSHLLDVLSYTTHYNAMIAHMLSNECFIDSAQLRQNIVSLANMLGYTPRSILAPRATIKVTLDVSEETRTIPSSIKINRGTNLTSIVDGEEFNFVVLNDASADYNQTNNNFVFDSITIAQGDYKELFYRVDNDISNQKFQLVDTNVDTTTLRTKVQLNQDATAYDNYTLFDTLQNVKSDTQIYYLQENASGLYEVSFGDGVIGKKLNNNNIVNLDYVITDGEDANGANVFTFTDTIQGFSNIAIETLSNALGGTLAEDKESIRYNAPLSFITQNRAVTSEDYASILKKEFSNISSISTWGGEDNDPPDYGKVYISIKPLDGNVLSTTEKNIIVNNVLKNKNIVSITPIILDPDFTHIDLDVSFKYNTNTTDRTKEELELLVKDIISDYNFNELNKFDGVYRNSRVLGLIDNSEVSITSSTVRAKVFKNISGKVAKADNSFVLNYTTPFFNRLDKDVSVISSTGFLIDGVEHFFADTYIEAEGSNKRQVIVYKTVEGKRITVIGNAGAVYPSLGKVELNNFGLDEAATITISATPETLDMSPKRNQLLNIDNDKIVIKGEIDTVAVGGPSGTLNYYSPERIRIT